MTHFVSMNFDKHSFKDVVQRFQSWIKNMEESDPLHQARREVYNALSNPSWTDNEILEASRNIALEDIIAYHKRLLAKQYIRVFAFGNYKSKDIKEMTSSTLQLLGPKRTAGSPHHKEFIIPKAGKDVLIQKDIKKGDVAYSEVYIHPETSLDKKIHIDLFNAFFNHQFFTQMRTHEQLGYVVGSMATHYNRYPAFVIELQSNNTELPIIKAKIDKFKLDFWQGLQQLDDASITALKESFLQNFAQKPNNLAEESSSYIYDFSLGNNEFDTKQSMMKALKSVTKEDIIKTYKELIIDRKSMNLVVQLRGTSFKESNFADLNADSQAQMYVP